jgi:hypothetical protein
VRTIGLAYGSWWDSFIGNVLGRSGKMAGWQYTDPAMSCDAEGNNCTGNNGGWGVGTSGGSATILSGGA